MVITNLSIFLGVLFEIYSINYFFEGFCRRKQFSRKMKIVFFLAIIIYHILISFFFKAPLLSIFAFLTTIFISLLFEMKAYLRIILCIIITIINISGEQIFGAIFILVNKSCHLEVNFTPESYLLGTLLSKFFVYIVICIIRFGKDMISVSYIENKSKLSLIILPVTTLLFGILMEQIISILTSNVQKAFYLFVNLFLILSNITTFEVIRNQEKLSKTKFEYELLKFNIEEQKKHYEQINSSQYEIRKIRHNIKNTIIATIAEIKSGNLDNAVAELSSNLEVIENSESVIDTGHPAIDSIIESKTNICNNNGIDIDISYSYQSPITINEVEIALIVGLILDNAIEACLDLENERQIWGTIISDDSIIINIKK